VTDHRPLDDDTESGQDDWGEDDFEPIAADETDAGTETEPDDEPENPENGVIEPGPRGPDTGSGPAHAEAGDPSAEAADGQEEPPPLYYGSVDEFLREYLRHMYSRPINGRSRVWAARWWEHSEAVARLDALWRSWEHLRQDASTGASVWWRDHADHHMSVLMDPDGPFAAADPNDLSNQASRGTPLPYEQPPEGLFPDVRATPAPAGPASSAPAPVTPASARAAATGPAADSAPGQAHAPP